MSASATEPAVVSWLAGQRDAMIALLGELVSIDSGSYNKPGTDAVGAAIRRFLEAHEIPVETRPQRRFGDCLIARVPSAGNEGKVVLMGHRDTVFLEGEVARRPFRIEGELAFGPGVADMKAGLVMNCFLLAAFRHAGGASGPLVGVFTGDEEIGSPEGRAVIEAETAGARAVFNSEPGRISGNVVSGRKGGVFSELRIEGKAAHSGGNFREGISAIEELAQKIIAIHRLTDLARGVTLNVGVVSGGQSVNTVAPWAEARIDLRYVKAADRDEMMGKLREIAAKSFVRCTSAQLAIKGEFLPLEESERSRRLLEVYIKAASQSGFATSGEFSGGCADSGFTAAKGIPTVCAVGPVGGKAHSPEEFLRLDSLVPRAEASARAIMALGAAGL